MRAFATFQIILLSVFGALALAGVLIFAVNSNSNKTSSAIGSITIWGTLPDAPFNNALSAASDNDTSLSGVTYVQKDGKNFDANVTQSIAKGTAPDLILLESDYVFQTNPELTPIPYESLSKERFQSTFATAADSLLGSRGVLGVPLLIDPLVMYWNKDILSSVGIASAPQYWDQLYDMATLVNKKNDAGVLSRSLISLGSYDNIDHAKDIIALLVEQAGGAITAYNEESKLEPRLAQGNGGGSSDAAATAIRFYTDFSDPSKQFYSWSPALPHSMQAFAHGDLAFYLGYASEANTIATINPNLTFLMAPVPQIKNSTRTITTAHVYSLSALRNNQRTGSAITAAYLLAASSTASLISREYRIPPARRDLLSYAASGTPEIANKSAIAAVTWIDPLPDATNSIFAAMINDIASGAILVSDAIQRADGQLKQAILQAQ